MGSALQRTGLHRFLKQLLCCLIVFCLTFPTHSLGKARQYCIQKAKVAYETHINPPYLTTDFWKSLSKRVLGERFSGDFIRANRVQHLEKNLEQLWGQLSGRKCARLLKAFFAELDPHSSFLLIEGAQLGTRHSSMETFSFNNAGDLFIRVPTYARFGPEAKRWLAQLTSVLSESNSRVVIDLRSHPGGSFAFAKAFVSLFTSPGDVGFLQLKSGELLRLEDRSPQRFFGELELLANGDTASSAEFILKVLTQKGLATYNGPPTFGKNTIQYVRHYFSHQLNAHVKERLSYQRFFGPSGPR